MAGSNRYQLGAPVRRRHRHRLRFAGRRFRIEDRNSRLFRGVLQRIEREEPVVAPVDAVDGAVGVGRWIPLVGGELIVRECRRAAPVPHRQDEIPLETLWPRRRRGDIPRGDAIGPVREHLQPARAPEHAHRRAHPCAILPDLHAVIPGRHAGRKSPERRGKFTRRFVAQLVADVAVRFDLVNPVMLRGHFGTDAVSGRPRAREVLLGRNVDERVPVVRRVDLRGCAGIGRRHRGECEPPARCRADWRGIDEAIASHPDLVCGASSREIGQQVPALIVRDDDLPELGGRVGGLRNHPDAGLRAASAPDRSGDIVGIDRNPADVDFARWRLRAKPERRAACQNKRE